MFGRPRGRPGLALATGVVVGGAVASRRAAGQQQEAMYQQQQQAQLAQANAEAETARQAAQQASQPAAIAYAVTASPAAPAQAVVVQAAPAAPAADIGRSMLNTALSGEPSVEELIALKKQLTVVQLMCDQALQLYQQSMQLTNKAQRSNTVGVVVGMGHRANAMDLALDAKRDAETKKAIAPAEKASQMLVEGFKQIPDALRLRYPQEMSRVGNVPATSLAVGSFGKAAVMSMAFGRTGEAINDIGMAKKIRENEANLARCMQIVNEQKQLMAIVQARLDQDISNLQRSKPEATAAVASPPVTTAAPALAAPPPPAMVPRTQLQLIAPHTVDELNVAMQQHHIISVPAGAVVNLIRGNLSAGLGQPYQDYVEVEFNGKVGKISRLVVQPYNQPAGVPLAIGAQWS